MMRYEILYWHGGFAVNADSRCIRELPAEMFNREAFSCFENEFERPALLAAGYLASKPKTELLKTIILSIFEDTNIDTLPT